MRFIMDEIRGILERNATGQNVQMELSLTQYEFDCFNMELMENGFYPTKANKPYLGVLIKVL